MFKRILFPTDFSECSHKVLEYLVELRNTIQEIVLVRVINLNRLIGVTSGVDIDAWIKHEEEESEKKLSELINFLQQHRIKASYISPIPAGDPVTEITKAAEKEKASLIVIGSRGKGILKEILVGSVSEGVVRKATVPVIVIKSKLVEKNGRIRCEVKFTKLFDRILYTHDLSEYSNKIINYVKQAALSGGRDVILLHIIEGEDKEEVRKDAEKKLVEIKSELETENIGVEVIIRTGTPYKEIIKVAKEKDTSLIMMGSRGKGFVEGMLVGSTTDAVVRHGDTATFVYKVKE